MITPDTIQKIKDAAHIEEVVGRFLSLRKRGTNYVACCPFHQEKTGSFNVNPARNIYKCFGCGKSGDSISFLMEHDHKTYPEALRYLAEMYGVEIEEEELSEEVRARQHERDSLLKLTAFAQQHFASALPSDLLRQRGITPEVARDFGLGLKADEGFTAHALAQGYSAEVLTASGLADAEQKDLLPAGLIFPIYSKDGKVISFVSRGERWSFLRPTALFDYGRALYGFFQGRKAIGQRDKCYLVSHFAMVLSMHQAGIENTVAPCSAAVTEQQIKDLKRFTHNITLVCGPQVAARFDASPLFAAGMHLRIVVFPQGETPDSYVRAHGATALQEYLDDQEENFFLHRARLLAGQPEALRGLLMQVTDPMERDAYLSLLADMMGITDTQLRQQWGLK